MLDKNEALFVVRLPFGQKTVLYEDIPALIALAKSPGFDPENADAADEVIFVCNVGFERRALEGAVHSGDVEVLNTSLHRVMAGRLEKGLLTVRALRGYLESIHGFLEVEDAPAQNNATPVPVAGVQLGEPDKAGPGWSLKTSLKRASGYRYPLYQVMKAAHLAGQPCPNARDVLHSWTLKPPPDVQVMPDGVKYNDGLGNPREADLKAIQQAIKNLLKL